MSPAEQAVCLCERLQILSRLERGDGQDVGRTEVGGRPVGGKHLPHPRRGDTDALGIDTEKLRHVRPGERGVDEDHIAGTRRVSVLAPVHRARPLCGPVRKPDRHEVVDRRRAHAGPLGGKHPVREVENVERAEEPLRRRMAGHAPGGTQRVRRGQRPGAHLDLDPCERFPDAMGPAEARRREGDDLVFSPGSLEHPSERPADVVADTCRRMGERTDVESDPHGR